VIERRIEKLDDFQVTVDEHGIELLQRLLRPIAEPRAGKNRPALRQGINLAFGVGGRAEGLAIVEIGAAVPLAVPGMLLDVLAELAGFGGAEFGEGDVAPVAGD